MDSWVQELECAAGNALVETRAAGTLCFWVSAESMR